MNFISSDVLWPDFDEEALKEAIAELTVAIVDLEEYRNIMKKDLIKEDYNLPLWH